MPISMYMGKPLSGQSPKIAIDLFDSSLTNFAPAYLTNKLNEKIMNDLTDKSGTTTINENVITTKYDDGTVETLTLNDNNYVIKTFDKKGVLLKNMVVTYNESNGTIRTDVTYDGSVNGVVNFATASWEEIGSMVQRHYAGIIDLTKFWSIGDERTISFSQIPNTGVGESHAAGTQKIKIIGFNHDTITGGSKAAITLQLSNGLGVPGYMHPSKTNSGGWALCNRRTWCNGAFYNSLDEGLRKIIKSVDKGYLANGNSGNVSIISDKCFLLSESELVGNDVTLSSANEGEQYPYYIGRDTLRKRQGDNVSGFDNWFTRSIDKTSNNKYVFVESDGEINSGDANSQYQIIPAMCI